MAAAIAIGTGTATGALLFSSSATKELAHEASADRSLQAFEQTLQESGASPAVIDAVARAVLPVNLTVDGYRIPNYGLAMDILGRARFIDLTTPAAIREAIIGTLTDMAESHMLYDEAVRGHVAGPTPAQIRRVEDDESAAIAHDKHSPFPSLAAAQQYYHSKAFVHSYVRNVIETREREKLTNTGNVLTYAQFTQIRRVLVAWALRVFPGRVTVSGLAGVTTRTLAMGVQ